MSEAMSQYLQLFKEEQKDKYRDINVWEAARYADNLVRYINQGIKKGNSKKGTSISGGKLSTLSESVPYVVDGESTNLPSTSTNGKPTCDGRAVTQPKLYKKEIEKIIRNLANRVQMIRKKQGGVANLFQD